jgi:predicted nucleic acid-binding protein
MAPPKSSIEFIRADGLTAAQTAWTNTLDLPLDLRRDADDAFALALAERLDIPLVTTDHHEFDAIERKGHFRFMWLR